MLKDINLQLLAEGDPVVPAAPAAPKTFSEEYVHELREENKLHRQAKKSAEDRLRKLVGLKDDEEIDDAKLTTWQNSQQKNVTERLSLADRKLVSAEIKSLEGYDSKLVDRLLDRKDIKVADDGTVTGVKEAVEKLEKEFPAIKKSFIPANPANPADGKKTPQQEYNEAMTAAASNPKNAELQRQAFLLGERLRQKK
jgi:hypothetical protein